MTTYTSVFGDETVPPSDNSFSAFSITADTTFYWPEAASGSYLIADTMEVSASSTYALTFPDARLVSNGRSFILSNTGANTITYKDNAGGTLGTLAAGIARVVYVKDNSTAAGTWGEFSFGATASSVNPASLDGYGLTVTGSTLSQEYLTVTSGISSSVGAADRAKTFIYSSSGALTCTLLAAGTAGNGFFVNVSNQGTGAVTIDANSTETIDGETTKELSPGESLTLVCDGSNWVSVGYGRSTLFQFTKLVLDITAGGTFTLTSDQTQNKLIQFIGIAPGNVTVVVPAVVAVYYLQSSYTGAYTVEIKTAAGLSVTMANTDRSIVYCDGTDVVLAQTSAAPATNLAGGVAGSIVYQSGVGTTAFSAAGTSGQVVLSGGTGSPTFSNLSIITNTYTGKTTPVDADFLPLYDSAATTTGTKVSWANAKATLKTANDLLYQPLDTDLTAIAALTSAADKLPYATGAGTWALTDLVALGRTLIGRATAALMRQDLGIGDGGAVNTASNAVVLTAATKYPAIDGSLITNISGTLLYANDFRLTLTSGLPVTTADVTAASTLYCTPCTGKNIGLYNGSAWVVLSSAEFSLALSGLTSGKPYDVFCYDNAGSPTLELLVWTDDTTRATALAYQDGVLVKSGAATRRYMGTFYTTATTTTEDSYANRYLWNYYHRVDRPMSRVDTTDSWTYSTAAWRQANASTSNQLNFVVGVAEDMIEAVSNIHITNNAGGVNAAAGVGLNSTTVNSAQTWGGTSTAANTVGQGRCAYRGIPVAGRNYMAWLERTEASGTTTFYGDVGGSSIQTGIVGSMRG